MGNPSIRKGAAEKLRKGDKKAQPRRGWEHRTLVTQVRREFWTRGVVPGQKRAQAEMEKRGYWVW